MIISKRGIVLTFVLSTGLVLCAGTASGQSPVTLDFNAVTNVFVPPPGGAVPLPWIEDGFAVRLVPGAGTTAGVEVGSPFFPRFPDGHLFMHSTFGGLAVVTITNNSGARFDLDSLRYVTYNLSPPPQTDLQSVFSSAGGLMSLSSAAMGDTVTFSGPEWHNLTFVQFRFQTGGQVGSGELDFDDIVLTPHPVPEPGSVVFAAIGAALVATGVRKRIAESEQVGK